MKDEGRERCVKNRSRALPGSLASGTNNQFLHERENLVPVLHSLCNVWLVPVPYSRYNLSLAASTSLGLGPSESGLYQTDEGGTVGLFCELSIRSEAANYYPLTGIMCFQSLLGHGISELGTQVRQKCLCLGKNLN